MVSLGGFILFFGFLAFNGGSQLSITGDGDAEAVSLVIVNTVLSGNYKNLPTSYPGHFGYTVEGSRLKWPWRVT